MTDVTAQRFQTFPQIHQKKNKKNTTYLVCFLLTVLRNYAGFHGEGMDEAAAGFAGVQNEHTHDSVDL